MSKTMIPQSMLWNITTILNGIITKRRETATELARVSALYYKRRAEVTLNDDIVARTNQTLRDAEVTLQMDGEPITREYYEARLTVNLIEKEFEMYSLISANCRALVYSKEEHAKGNTGGENEEEVQSDY